MKFLVHEATRFDKEVALVMFDGARSGEFEVIDASNSVEAAQEFLDKTNAEACLVFSLPGVSESFIRSLKAVKP